MTAQWESYRSEIERLYISENKTLEEVIAELRKKKFNRRYAFTFAVIGYQVVSTNKRSANRSTRES